MLEEEAYFDATGVHNIDGRQKEILLIPGKPANAVKHSDQ